MLIVNLFGRALPKAGRAIRFNLFWSITKKGFSLLSLTQNQAPTFKNLKTNCKANLET